MAKKSAHATTHQTREATKRAAEPVHDEEDAPWQRGASLEMPPARPGMDQRWIRVEAGGKPDSTNWSRKQREGWSARKADSVAETFPVPRIDQGKFSGFIGVEGMILCERPMAISKRRERHFRGETARRTEAIQADLQRVNTQNRSNAFGPIQMATKSQVVYEKRTPLAADD